MLSETIKTDLLKSITWLVHCLVYCPAHCSTSMWREERKARAEDVRCEPPWHGYVALTLNPNPEPVVTLTLNPAP